ncbi:MAG TPA: glycosyltransferase family 2 protein [Gammaproteobacteria bacterium]|nr:glycosyltransferase family 2 protein [Gammaproteobacteria bacterium]
MHCSIIIVNWNSWELLALCLEALARQTNKGFKVYVADNASESPPPAEIFSILPDLNYIQNDNNIGFAAANNTLIEQARDAQWTVLLNPDTCPEPDWIAQLLDATKRYTDYQAYSSRLVQYDNHELLDGDGDEYHVSGLAWRKGFNKRYSERVTPTEVFSPCAAAAMYRTDVLLELGGFDEDFFCYFEDVDLGFRLRLAGHKCLLIPSAVVYHVGSATTGGQQSDFSVYYGHRNLVWTFVKNMPGLLFWLFLPVHILLNIISLFWFIFKGQGRVILRSKRDALARLPRMLRKRKAIQVHRVASISALWRIMNKSIFHK